MWHHIAWQPWTQEVKVTVILESNLTSLEDHHLVSDDTRVAKFNVKLGAILCDGHAAIQYLPGDCYANKNTRPATSPLSRS